MNTIEKTTELFTSFDGTPIYYELRGEGEPVIFIYGIGCLINHWHHQLHHFSNTMKTVAFDLRGHHKSQPVSSLESLTMNDLARDLLALMDHLKLPSAHVVGHSFGAPVVLAAYQIKPEAFQSITFINGFAKNPIKGMFGVDVVEPFYHFIKSAYEKNPAVWNTLWRLAVDNPVSMRLAALAGGFNLHTTHFKDIEVYARGVAAMDLQIFLKLFDEMMKYDGYPVLPQIQCPVLIVSGEQDRVTPKSFQEDFRHLIPHSEFVLVPYGSHCTQLDFPDYVNLKLAAFWEKQKGS